MKFDTEDRAKLQQNAVPRSQGFTLLEVLVVLVVLGLIMVVLSQSTQIGMRSTALVARNDAAASEMEQASRALRQMIARATPSDTAGLNDNFVGQPHQLSLVTRLPQSSFGQNWTEAEVTLAVGNAHRLEMQWRPHYQRWISPQPAPQIAAIIDGVERFDLSYWQSGDGGGTWVDTWTRNRLPALVRLRVVFAAQDGRHWPDLIAAPMRESFQP